jgi:hypothetical protein
LAGFTDAMDDCEHFKLTLNTGRMPYVNHPVTNLAPAFCQV